MLRYLTLFATLSLLVLWTLVPTQGVSASGCASQTGAAMEEICYAPGATAPQRAQLGKPCSACGLPEAIALPDRPHTVVSLGTLPDAIPTPGRTVSPDRRPPRA